MSENYSYEKILPIAPLKIVALEGCRDLAKEVDKFLVDFRKKEIRNSRIHQTFMVITKKLIC